MIMSNIRKGWVEQGVGMARRARGCETRAPLTGDMI